MSGNSERERERGRLLARSANDKREQTGVALSMEISGILQQFLIGLRANVRFCRNPKFVLNLSDLNAFISATLTESNLFLLKSQNSNLNYLNEI